jgi:hypothetical protein
MRAAGGRGAPPLPAGARHGWCEAASGGAGERQNSPPQAVDGERPLVPDITALILEDHELLRRRFAALDDVSDSEALAVLWQELSALLDVHAACEEEVFYPELLHRHTDDAEAEAEDAIDDHNKIRDAVRAAANFSVGSEDWWAAVRRANEENSKHIAEEEREALPDFRHAAAKDARERLAVRWTQWRLTHQPPRGVDTNDKDADSYLSAHAS